MARIRPTLTDVDLAYLAGLIDGEGSITINRINQRRGTSGVSTHVSVANTYEPVIRWVGEITDCGSATATYNHLKPTHRRLYRWDWASGDALWLLHEIAPFLRIKHAQAEVAFALETETDRHRVLAGGPFGNGRPVPIALIEFRQECRARLNVLNFGRRFKAA